MSKPANKTGRKTFLLGQPLFHLVESDHEARWQAVINEAEPRDDLREKAFVPALRPPRAADAPETHPAWARLDREKQIPLWADPPDEWRRVAIICGAGLGKTTTLKFLEDAINAHAHCRGKQLAFFLEIGELPESPAELLSLLIRKMRKWHTGAGAGVEAQLESALIRRRRQGRITLLLDSLDQAGPQPQGKAMTALRDLLDSVWSVCPIWISGRPHALKPNRSLFDSPGSPAWQFVRVGQLDEPECRFLLEDARARTERGRRQA